MGRGVDWDDLRVFAEVSRGQHITAVAKRLGVDQSTVSRRIAHLEAALGVRVLERSRDRLVLTEFGKRALMHIVDMERGASAVRELADGITKSSPPLVRISTYEAFSTFYLAERLGGFQAQQAARIEIVPELKLINASLKDADVFISFYEPEARGLERHQVGTITIRLYASSAYLEKTGMPRSIDELAQHRFISFIPALLNFETARFLDEIIADRVEILNSPSLGSQMAAAAGGMGIVMLPAFAARREDRLRPILWEEVSIKRPIWLSAHEDLRFTPRIKSLISYLTKLLAADGEILNEDPRCV